MSSALARYERSAHVTHPGERERVNNIAAALERAESAAGSGRLGVVLRAEAEALGMGYGTLRRHYDVWRKSQRDPMALVDGRKMRPDSAQENRWLQVYMRYCENDKNTSRNAWRVMMQDFRNGSCADGALYAEVFSAVGTWRELYAEEHPHKPYQKHYPAGWVPRGASASTLQRAANKNPDYLFQIAASRQGRKAAHQHLIPVLKSRRHLAVGSIRQWDDVWHNTDVRMPEAGVVQPLEFAGYDVASAYKCDSVIKPRFMRADGKRDNLKEQTFRFLQGFAHCVTGFHKEGVTNIVEWGTAAIRPPVEKQIKLIPGFGELINFQRSGILSEQVHAGLFVGGGAGNFRMKPLVESSHRVMQNRVASMIGDRGRDAEHMHESRNALVKYEESLMLAAARLPAEIATKIEYGLLTFDEYHMAFREIEREWMDDPVHMLEGWDDHQITEYSPVTPPCDEPSTWCSIDKLLSLPQDEAKALAVFLKMHPECLRTRWMSRREVWEQGKVDFIRVPLMEMPAFLDERDMIEVTVRKNGTIEFSNYYFYGRDKMIYRADAVQTPDGYTRRLAPEEKVLVKYNPFTPDNIWIINRENGKTRGMAPIHSRVPMQDREAIERAMGIQSHDLARKIMPVRGRHQPEAEKRAGRMARNQSALLGLARNLPTGSMQTQQSTDNALDYFAIDEAVLTH